MNNSDILNMKKKKKWVRNLCFGKTLSVKNTLILIKLVLLTDDEEKSHISLVQDKKMIIEETHKILF